MIATTFCRACGTKQEPDARFCNACGAAVAEPLFRAEAPNPAASVPLAARVSPLWWAGGFGLVLVLGLGYVAASPWLKQKMNSELDRSEAVRLIQKSAAITKKQELIRMHKNALNVGFEFGWWLDPKSRDLLHVGISSAVREDLQEFVFNFGENQIRASKLAPINVNVTGIVNSPENVSAMAEFEWRYIDLPYKVSFIAVQGGKGKASLQRFDDGWRITEVIFDPINIEIEGEYKVSESNQSSMSIWWNSLNLIQDAARVEGKTPDYLDLMKAIPGTWHVSDRWYKFEKNGNVFSTGDRKGNGMNSWGKGVWSLTGNMLELTITQEFGMFGVRSLAAPSNVIKIACIDEFMCYLDPGKFAQEMHRKDSLRGR